jgi:hypothetical protein
LPNSNTGQAQISPNYKEAAKPTPPIRKPVYTFEQVRDALMAVRGRHSKAAKLLDCSIVERLFLVPTRSLEAIIFTFEVWLSDPHSFRTQFSLTSTRYGSNVNLTRDDLEKITDLTLSRYNERAEDFWEGTRDHNVSQNIAALLQCHRE